MKPQGLAHLPLFLCAVLVALGPSAEHPARGADVHESFEDGPVSWRVLGDQAGARLQEHRRQGEVSQTGSGSEHVGLLAARDGSLVWLEHSLTPARVIQELKLAVQVRLSGGGAKLRLRVVFPHERDAVTGAPVTAMVAGDEYTETGRWQQLTCVTSGDRMADLLRRLRLRTKNRLFDATEAYVDRAYLILRLPAGRTDVYLDELHLSPVVEPRGETIAIPSEPSAEGSIPVDFRLGRLLLKDGPFFPRIAPYHGESPDVLKLAGIDVAWVPDYEDDALLDDLRRHGLWATASPPSLAGANGTALEVSDVSMLPFTDRTRNILFWNLGTRVPADQRENLSGLLRQIRSADRKYKRPVIVDIIGGQERTVSREVDMLAVSRHICNTTFTPRQYRDWLVQRQLLAQQGQFLWTWVQTEPATVTTERRQAAGRAPIVTEPEQVRFQVYSALAAGCRGIGFFKTTPLDGDAPGDTERRLILAQLGLELDLLEPWLATGLLEAQVPFEVEHKRLAPIGRKSIDFRHPEGFAEAGQSLVHERQDRRERAGRIGAELEAAIIKSDLGTLLLPIWYERDAQFVPGQMAAHNATIVVPGVPDTALAYEITTTSIHPVSAKDQRRVAGGMKIVLPRFDQTGAVLVTADRAVIERLRQRQSAVAESSARISVELARAKLARTAQVDAELRALGHSQSEGSDLLAGATDRADRAAQALARGDYHMAREYAGESMQFLRILQRRYWEDAVRGLASPVSSPHAVCFQTLPDHWRMLSQLRRSAEQKPRNQLPSGNFEDPDAMVAEGWQHAQNEIPGVRANADLPRGRGSDHGLRLVAVAAPGKDVPAVLPRSPVIVNTPAVKVRAGQTVHVSGWVRMGAPVTGNLDGAMLYDSLDGPAGALRWHAASDWRPFDLLRQAHEDGELTLTFVLNGLGAFQIDDLQITCYDPTAETLPPPATSPQEPSPFSPLQLLERLPRLRPNWSRQ